MDEREVVELELEHDELFQLMLLAHEQDITLNQLVENLLTEFINKQNTKE